MKEKLARTLSQIIKDEIILVPLNQMLNIVLETVTDPLPVFPYVGEGSKELPLNRLQIVETVDSERLQNDWRDRISMGISFNDH